MSAEPVKLPSGDIWRYAISLPDAARRKLESAAMRRKISPDALARKLVLSGLGIQEFTPTTANLNKFRELAGSRGFDRWDAEFYARIAEQVRDESKAVNWLLVCNQRYPEGVGLADFKTRLVESGLLEFSGSRSRHICRLPDSIISQVMA